MKVQETLPGVFTILLITAGEALKLEESLEDAKKGSLSGNFRIAEWGCWIFFW